MISTNLTPILRSTFCVWVLCCVASAQDTGQGEYIPEKKVQETVLSVLQATPVGGDPAEKSPDWMEWRLFPSNFDDNKHVELLDLIRANPTKVFIFYAHTPLPVDGELFVWRRDDVQLRNQNWEEKAKNGLFCVLKSAAETRLLPIPGTDERTWVLELAAAEGRISPLIVAMRGPGGTGRFVSTQKFLLASDLKNVFSEGQGEGIGPTSAFQYNSSSHTLSIKLDEGYGTIAVDMGVESLRYAVIKWNEESRPIATPEELTSWRADMPEWMLQALKWPTREEMAGKPSEAKAGSAKAWLPVFQEQNRHLVPLDLKQHIIKVEDWGHFGGWGDSAKPSVSGAHIVRYEGHGTVFELCATNKKNFLMLRDYDGLFGIPKEASLLEKVAFVAEKSFYDVPAYSTAPDPAARYKVQQEGKDGKWISGTLHRGALHPGPHESPGQEARFITNGVFYLFDLR